MNLNINNLNITRIKPAFINREALAEIAAECLAKLNPNEKADRRWINAIAKAVRLIETGKEMIFDLATKTLHIEGTNGERYAANGVCQCKAFQADKQPCKHRAAKRLIILYIERLNDLPF